MSKFVSMELILRDQAISELYAANKATRKAAHGHAVGLFAQLEDLLGPWLVARCQVPDSVLIRPLAFGERYVRLASGVLVIVNPARGTAQRVFPI